MLRCRKMLLSTLLVAVWTLPQAAEANKTRLPAPAKALLKSKFGSAKLVRSAHRSATLWGKDGERDGRWVSGQAFIYGAKGHGEKYLVVEHLGRSAPEWSIHAIAKPLTDGRVSRNLTKGITFPSSGAGPINLAFSGKAATDTVVGVTVRGTTQAAGSGIVATSVDRDANTITFYAMPLAKGKGSPARVEATIGGGATQVNASITPAAAR